MKSNLSQTVIKKNRRVEMVRFSTPYLLVSLCTLALLLISAICMMHVASSFGFSSSSSTISVRERVSNNANAADVGVGEETDNDQGSSSGSRSYSGGSQYEYETPSGQKLSEDFLPPKPEGFECDENAYAYYSHRLDKWRCKCDSGYAFVHRKCVMKHPDPLVHTEMLMPGAHPPKRYDEMSTKKSTKVWFLDDGNRILKYFLKGRECYIEKEMSNYLRWHWINEVPRMLSETPHSVLMPNYGQPMEDFLFAIRKDEKWPVERVEKLITTYIHKCIDIMDRIHAARVTIMDIKGYNILVNYNESISGTEADRLQVTYIDFEGSKRSKVVDKDKSSYIYTFKYAAPEVVMHSERWITNRADVWSFGIHMLKMIFRNFSTGHVYRDLRKSDSRGRSSLTHRQRMKHAMKVHSYLRRLGDGEAMRWKVLTRRYKFRMRWSKHFISLMSRSIERMMVFDQEERASTREILALFENERSPRIGYVAQHADGPRSALQPTRKHPNDTRFSKQRLIPQVGEPTHFALGGTKL